jgi:hypothetical protein
MTNRKTAYLGRLAGCVTLILMVCACSSSAHSTAISKLARAYQKFFASNGKSSHAKEDVAVASRKLNSICPGAAS